MTQPSPLHVSSFQLKLAAIVGMTLCHVGVIFQSALPWWAYCACEAFGGLTFPIMAFLVTEGYRHTHDLRRYMARMLVFAVVSQVPYGLFFEPVTLQLGQAALALPFTGNVLFTLLVGLVLVWGYDHVRRRAAFWVLACAAVLASAVFDWGVVGPVMVLMAHILPEPDRRRLPAALPVLALGLPAAGSLASGDASALPQLLYELVGGLGAMALLGAYDGTRGRPLKWAFYLYYPLHILVLGLLGMLVL